MIFTGRRKRRSKLTVCVLGLQALWALLAHRGAGATKRVVGGLDGMFLAFEALGRGRQGLVLQRKHVDMMKAEETSGGGRQTGSVMPICRQVAILGAIV